MKSGQTVSEAITSNEDDHQTLDINYILCQYIHAIIASAIYSYSYSYVVISRLGVDIKRSVNVVLDQLLHIR